MLSGLSLKKKILGASIVASLLLAVVGTVAVWSLRDVVHDMRHIAERSLTRLNTMSDMRYYGSEVGRLFLRVSTQGLGESEVTRLKGKLEEHIDLYKKADDIYRQIPFDSAEEEALYKAQNEKWDAFVVIVRKGVSLIGSQKPEDVTELAEMVSTTVAKAKVAHNNEFAKMAEYENAEAEKWKSAAMSSGARGSFLATTVVALGFLLNIFGGLFFSGRLSQGLEQVAGRLNAGADDVAVAAGVISETSTALSSSVTQQASSIQETASAVTELTAIVSRNASAAETSCRVADDSVTAAREGQAVVQEMNEAMSEINRANSDIMSEVQTSNEKFADIVKVIAEIGDKTKVINDIVFQTKLLSFNASVEAARAGEQGKGFAVVAEEVGNLAQMSGAAAKEISQLLSVSMDRVKTIVDENQTNVGHLVEVGRKKVERGTEVAHRCGLALDTLVHNAGEVNSRVAEIAQSTKEQSAGIQEISSAMGQLDEATQRNASAAESSANAASDLRAQSEQLHLAARDLMVMIRGGEEGFASTVHASNGSDLIPFKKGQGKEKSFKVAG